MLILNSGGTLNKRYNSISGKLEVPYDNLALERILDSVDIDYNLAGVVYKDSLDMVAEDRKMLASIIYESKENKFLVIHGTDTIHLTAEFFDEFFDDRLIVLTGAMNPFEIDNVEASLNIGISIGFLKASKETGVYICMNGYVEKYNNIKKNKNIGKFQIVR